MEFMEGGNIQLARLLEFMPRAIQLYRSIQATQVKNGELRELSELELLGGQEALDKCKGARLGALESDVMISDYRSGEILFQLSCPLIGWEEEDQIHLVVESYIKVNDGKILRPYQTEFHYTPSILRYDVLVYVSEENVGRALISGPQSTLLLESEDGSQLLEYHITDVGMKLLPQLKEAYIVR